MPTSPFHPIIAQWFADRFGEPTDPQRLGWPEIVAGRNTLIAAPTGSGKTLAAFLASIDRLLRQGLEGELADETQVVYISPLKALSNDIRRNLETPLAEIGQYAVAAGRELPPLRAMVRTGDTPSSERQKMLKRPPHILVTTPESLYLLLTAAKGREMLRNVRTVIVDEIHALARDKRGSHLALSLERLAALCPTPPVRIGLSATQRPIEEIARFLVGAHSVAPSGEAACSVVDVGHARELDLAVEVPASELSAVCSHETWAEIYQRITELVVSHRSTLIFVNTRRMAERVCYRLSELLGEGAVASHHGSLSRELRLSAEQRLQSGELKAIVATASLELGIDIGYIDLVCQIGSPRSIATFLQRVGRAGHSLGALPKGRLFALTRDELLECLALIRAVRGGRLDKIEIPQAPLDILAQQIVAATACEEWAEDELFDLCCGAWPYRNLGRDDFAAVLEILSEGISPGRRQGAYLHRDRIHRKLRARRGARIAAITSGGAIPELADYRVVTADEGTFVGTLNEDFAIESQAGDIFLLGNMSWRIMYVRGGEVVVQDAHAAPASVPFWLGEAPGRTIELAAEVSELRRELAERTGEVVDRKAEVEIAEKNGADSVGSATSFPSATAWLQRECNAGPWAAEQAAGYVAVQQAAIGVVPTQRQIVFERFFDESGGMQLVIHAPFSARMNRAWGLALRKRFCRSFDFELQASADDNGIVLSLGPQHSFPIEQMFRMLNRQNARDLLVQALLAVPMFTVRWRWNATRALAVLRQRGGKKVPPPLQRFRADDLLSAVFPAQTACQENVVGDIPIPDHPLVAQTVFDCLHEAMDFDRWLALLGDIETGRVELIAKDTREPSPFSYELLNANPYAFLDDAPLEERRARAVATRRSLSVESLGDLGRLDPAAIELVRADAWPMVRDADELHDCLLSLSALPSVEGLDWKIWFEELVRSGRATCLKRPDAGDLWVAAERWSLVRAAFPDAACQPPLALPPGLLSEHEASDAIQALVRGRLECCGPVTARRIAADLGLREGAVEAALEAIEGAGAVMRGRYSDPAGEIEWCDRRLLARIHRLTLDGARRRVQPAAPADFWRFLLSHHHLPPAERLDGRAAVLETIGQLQGFEAPAGAWERDIFPGRLIDYDPAWLDELSLSGEVAWGRLQPPEQRPARSAEGGTEESPTSDLRHPASFSGLTRVVPIALVARADLAWLLPLDRGRPQDETRSSARDVYETLVSEGASFFHDLAAMTGLLPAQLEDALGELAALGLVTADGFATIRSLVSLDSQRKGAAPRMRRRGGAKRKYARGGRWSKFPPRLPPVDPAERIESWSRQLLRRYGVMFRDLLARETVAPAWRELAAVYRRWEAQGKIRGGRFVSGGAGEQFALPEAVERLREIRERGADRAKRESEKYALTPALSQ
ncbi:MAG TPA: DEAD/DEAH box helicase, partial [Pirellulales bacterium]|nr:DEAD/DEAH box helicase [Pirellulales bacterium]